MGLDDEEEEKLPPNIKTYRRSLYERDPEGNKQAIEEKWAEYYEEKRIAQKLANVKHEYDPNAPNLVLEAEKSIINYDMIGDSYHLIEQNDGTSIGRQNAVLGVIGILSGLADTALNFVSLGIKPAIEKSVIVVGKETLIKKAETVVAKEVVASTETFVRTSSGEAVGVLADPLKVEKILTKLKD